jgi:hypothetical protein
VCQLLSENQPGDFDYEETTGLPRPELCSTMAKQQAGQVRADNADLGRAMGDLNTTLARLVDKDEVLCPKSAVHDQETDLFRNADVALSDRIHDVLTELSDGQSFQTYGYIEFGQTVRALRSYLGLSTDPEDGRWQHAFYRKRTSR